MYGKRIIELRRKQGFTQAELAKIIGISRSALSLYEIEKREPDIDTLNRIASAFDVSIDYLLGHTNTKKNDDSKHDYFFFFFDHWTECKKRIRSKMQELFISEQDFQSETNIDIEKEISIEDLITISEKLNVSTDYLLGKTENERTPQKDIDFANPYTKKERNFINVFRNLNEDNQDIIIGDMKKYLKEQRYESVAAGESFKKTGTTNSVK